MSQRRQPSLLDFWGFLQQSLARLETDAAKVTSDEQLNALIFKWLNEDGGILKEIETDPIFVAARPNAQLVFRHMIKNRVYQIEEAWREIWRSIYESEPPR